MSFFSRLRRRLSGKRSPPPVPEPAPVLADTGAAASAPRDDALLEQLLASRGTLALPEQRQLQELLDALRRDPAHPPTVDVPEVLRWVSSLVAADQDRQATHLLSCLTRLLPTLAALRLRLAELLCDRKEYREALPLLRELTDDLQLAPDAHFLLGDHGSREGELERALQHYEAVLALDFTYPRARQRAEELRARLDRPVAAASPTILGADDLSMGARFLLQRELGRGGCGTVYLALDRSLGRRVAVKVLHPEVRRRPDAWTRLFCEARVATALQHPGIVAVYDLDEVAHLVVMEYCAGGTLAERLARGAPPLPDVLRRLAEVCDVLDMVHRCGVVHRDLKPANLLSRGPERELPPLVLTDFGIAHAGRAEQSDEEGAGSLIYMSPEQRAGEAADPRADIYSCGVMLLEMVLGRPPLERHQALQGLGFLELDDVWRQMRDLVPASVAGPLLVLARALVDPLPGRRPVDAAHVAAQARQLGGILAADVDRQSVLAELQRRAGPPPRSAATEAWLAAQSEGLARRPDST